MHYKICAFKINLLRRAFTFNNTNLLIFKFQQAVVDITYLISDAMIKKNILYDS